MNASGAGPATWPTTPWTLIRTARALSPEERIASLEQVLRLYVKPVERFFARALRVNADVADDLAQDLFAKLLERDFLERLTHETSFRRFLKVVCRRHYAKWRAAERARRRVLDSLSAEQHASDEEALDAALDLELRGLYIEEVMKRVRRELLRQEKPELLAVFEARTRFDGAKPEEYSALAERFGKRIYEIRNDLTAARKIFKREMLRLVGEVADDPREELRELGLLKYVE